MHEPLEVRQLDKREYGAWDALVKASPAGTVYHDSRWLKAICRATGDTLAIYGFFQEGQLVAGAPLQVRKRGPLALALRPFATPYAGIVCQPDGDPNTLPPLIGRGADSLAKRFSSTTLTFSPFVTPPPLGRGWDLRERTTYSHRISALKGVWRSLASEVRNRMRKAERLKIAVAKDSNAPAFYDLYKNVFLRQNLVIPIARDSFSDLIDELGSAGIARTYVAQMPDGSPCAACLIVYDAQRAHYSLAASDPELRKTGAASLVVWEALRDLSPIVSEFDFGGANVPSVAQFKSKFRGRLVAYIEARRYRSYVEKRLLRLYQRIKHREREKPQ